MMYKGSEKIKINYQQGGGTETPVGTTDAPVVNPKDQTINNQGIQVPEKWQGKSYHVNPATVVNEQETIQRTMGDRLYDLFHPKQPGRVTYSFQEGGGIAEGMTGMIEKGIQAGQSAADFMQGSLRDMMTVPIHNPYNTKTAQRYKKTGSGAGGTATPAKSASQIKK